MQISSIQLTNADADQVTITLADGRQGSGPYPPNSGDWREAVNVWLDAGNQPTAYSTPPLSEDDVVAERAKRLATGFNYTFPNNDQRGTITIKTTDLDRAFWEKVTTMAQTYINAGSPASTFDIYPDMTAVTITAAEWFDIIAAWTAWEQPIILGSFWLQAQSQVPADYKTNNAYWSA